MTAEVGHPTHMPSLPGGFGGVSPTVPAVVWENGLGLVCFEENLVGLGCLWGHHHLKFHPLQQDCFQDWGSPTFSSAHNLKTRFCYTKQPLDLLRNFNVYFLWVDRCRKNFGDTSSTFKVFRQAWVSTVEVGMATWKDLSSTRPHETPEAKANLALIRADFISTWCFLDCSITRLHLYLLFSRQFVCSLHEMVSPAPTLILCLWCDAAICRLPPIFVGFALGKRKV
jgi:hypothetical protein